MEIYKQVQGFEKYTVSNFGNVKNTKTGRILKASNDGKGYLVVRLSDENKILSTLRVHLLVASHFLENPENKPLVDHIDNCTTNNKVTNLRYATFQENNRNSSLSSKNTSGVKGVSFHKTCNKWLAQITINGKTKNIGYFNSLEEAKQARCKKANEVFGEFTHSIEKIRNELNILDGMIQDIFN